MISLSVEKYCENCGEFEPETIVEEACFLGREKIFNTQIICKHAGRCSAMMEELRRRDAK